MGARLGIIRWSKGIIILALIAPLALLAREASKPVYAFEQGVNLDENFGVLVTVDPNTLPTPKKWSGQASGCRRDLSVIALASRMKKYLKDQKIGIERFDSADTFLFITTSAKHFGVGKVRYYTFKLRKYPTQGLISYRAEANIITAKTIQHSDGSFLITSAGEIKSNDGVSGRLEYFINEVLGECAP